MTACGGVTLRLSKRAVRKGRPVLQFSQTVMGRNEATAAHANQCLKCGQNHPAASNTRTVIRVCVKGIVELACIVNYFMGKPKLEKDPALH